MRNIPATLQSSSPKGSLRRFFTRRLWLPGVLYAALPFLYLLLGAAALASGIYMPDPGATRTRNCDNKITHRVMTDRA